jgi:hypothetical protein
VSLILDIRRINGCTVDTKTDVRPFKNTLKKSRAMPSFSGVIVSTVQALTCFLPYLFQGLDRSRTVIQRLIESKRTTRGLILLKALGPPDLSEERCSAPCRWEDSLKSERLSVVRLGQ